MSIVLVTGSARGLGLGLIAQLSNDPSVSKIIATSRGAQPSAALQSLITASSTPIIYVSLDTTDATSIMNAVGTITQKLLQSGTPYIDILINNAGTQIFEPGRTQDMSALETTLAINVVGVAKVTSALLPLLRASKGKKIANISSTVGSIGLVDRFAMVPVPSYSVSKAALNMLTVQTAMDLDKDGFTVFAVSPGWLKTDLGGKDVADLEVDVGAKATWEIIRDASREKGDNRAFRDIFVQGHELYTGENPPW